MSEGKERVDVLREIATGRLEIAHAQCAHQALLAKSIEDKKDVVPIAAEVSSGDDEEVEEVAADGMGDTRAMTRQQRCPFLQVMHRHISSERERESAAKS